MKLVPKAYLLVLNFLYLATQVHGFPKVSSLGGLFKLRNDEQHPLDIFTANLLSQRFGTSTANAKIQANVSIIDGKQPEWVTVSWSGISSPNANDVVALYAVGDGWKDKAPIKSIYAVESSTHLTDGSGSLQVYLLNHRVDVQFVFITRFFTFPEYDAVSDIITVENKDAPLYVHLALTGKENEMSVQWVSATNDDAFVKWGTESGTYENTAKANSLTYTPNDLCGPPATTQGYIFPGFLHAAIITDLVPETTYYYIFGNENGGYSEEHHFVAPHSVGYKDTIKIIGIGDMGQYNIDYFDNESGREPSLKTSANINAEENVDLIMHVGDISYAQGYVADWDVFFDQLHPITYSVPYMTIPGNHERLWPFSGDRYDVGTDSGGECGVAYERRLQMPVPGEDKPWYSFDFGPVHFTTFSTEQDFEEGSEQYTFLEQDLASVDRAVTPWVIVCHHRPMYPGIEEDRPPRGYWWVGQELQATFGDLFYENKVDMLWSGHHHTYQRTCPVHHEKCLGYDEETGEAKAPVQLVFGNAGARLYTDRLRDRDWIEFSVGDFGYMRFEVSEKRLHAESIRNSDKAVIDTVTLVKA